MACTNAVGTGAYMLDSFDWRQVQACAMRSMHHCRYLNDIYTRYGRPIWLTELACPNPNGTLDRQLKYARGAFKVLDEDDNVERWEAHTDSARLATQPPAFGLMLLAIKPMQRMT